MPDGSDAGSAQRQLRDAWVTRVLQVRFSAPDEHSPEPPPPPPGFTPGVPDPRRVARTDPDLKGMALWTAERGKAVATLTALETAFRGTDHPERDQGIILLRAVRANLTEIPATSQQVAELQAYLDTDDVVEAAELPNSFGVHVTLREPLSKALASLRAERGDEGVGP